MKVQLTGYNRIEKGKAGDIVEVSPDRARFLLDTGLAVRAPVREMTAKPVKVEKPAPVKAAPAKAKAETKSTAKAKTGEKK